MGKVNVVTVGVEALILIVLACLVTIPYGTLTKVGVPFSTSRISTVKGAVLDLAPKKRSSLVRNIPSPESSLMPKVCANGAVCDLF